MLGWDPSSLDAGAEKTYDTISLSLPSNIGARLKIEV